MNELKNPTQPLIIDKFGTVRFKINKLVKYLLDKGGLNMNDLAAAARSEKFSKNDQEQFAQLIGYSVSGFGDLSYVSDETYEKVSDEAAILYKSDNHAVNCMICTDRITDLSKKTSCYACGKVAHNEKCSHLVYVTKYYAHHTYCCNDCSIFCNDCDKYIYKNEPHNHASTK